LEQLSSNFPRELGVTGPAQISVPLNPALPLNCSAYRLFLDIAKELSACSNGNDVGRIRATAFRQATRGGAYEQTVRVCISVLCDLRLQGWSFRLASSRVEGIPPTAILDSSHLEKQRIRQAHLFERNAQLQIPSVREFIRRMERQQLGPNGWVSIFSLMRDGEELSSSLKRLSISQNGSHTSAADTLCIDPYIQIVQPGECCPLTGLKLTDVWRYFRHTWVTPYYSIPGRQMWILIRDRAVANHPIIGIAALCSAVVQLTPRDNWIGWSSAAFLSHLEKSPSSSWARWILSSLKELIDGVYVKDFLREGILTSRQLRRPTDSAIAKLMRVSEQARQWHRRYPKSRQHKNGNLNWQESAKTYLFRAKRARAIAGLLKARARLLQVGFDRPDRSGLMKALSTGAGRSAIEVILKHVKANHVGIDMLDITVCGAVPPYNAVLGGKLVAMLLASPEVISAYENKYKRAESIIASSMAGKPVVRKPRLSLLCTTSLYGVSSSQYNRIRIPLEQISSSNRGNISYELLGRSLGFGSYHLSAVTLAEMEVLLARSDKGRRVNSIFGEGVNPRLRKLRDGLTLAGFPSEVLLVHGNQRIIYGMPLAHNFRDLLVGRSKRPDYLLPRKKPKEVTQAIAKFWRTRWLAKRIQRMDVLEDVARHSLKHPIQHGGRVLLPPIEEDRPLFAAAAH
jgi:hypothetical protein